jgi:hypothetical protein
MLKDRRKNALARLQQQLKKGTKPFKAGEGTTVNEFVSFKGEEPLTEKDKTRIKKEIVTLQSRI